MRKSHYLKHREAARALAKRRIEHFSPIYQVSVRRISIRNQKTRWGSCSTRGNLNFNYKIALIPEHLADYIIVHELCHLREFNHSANFWNLVAQTFPNHLEIREELRRLPRQLWLNKILSIIR
jgi:hypothetical protein